MLFPSNGTKKMERLYSYFILMFLGTLTALIGVLGLFFNYSIIYIFVMFAGVIIFNLGYTKAYNNS